MSKPSAPGNQNQTLKFESPHKFFHMMMNMCDDDLDLHQYRLYGHYLRVAGDGGLCTESVRTTAAKCCMGHTTVIRARRELAKLGYIKVDEPTKEDAQRGETVKIEIVNRWAENIARYTKAVPDEKHSPEPVPNGEQGVPIQEQVSVPNQEQGVPNGESKKNGLRTVSEKPSERGSSDPVDIDAQGWATTTAGVFQRYVAITTNSPTNTDRELIPDDIATYGLKTVNLTLDRLKQRIADGKAVKSWKYAQPILEEIAQGTQPPPKVAPKGSPAPAPKSPPRMTPEQEAAAIAAMDILMPDKPADESEKVSA